MTLQNSKEFWEAVRVVHNELFRNYLVPSQADCETAVRPFAEIVARAFLDKTHYALLECWVPRNPADSLTIRLALDMVDHIYI